MAVMHGKGRSRLRTLEATLARAWGRVRVRSTTISGIAGGVIVAGCAALLVFQGLRTHTLPELLERAQADPKDASVQVELGHVYFEAGQRVAALKAYDKALQLDRDAATRRMLENLVSCYGSRQMGPAGAIITRYKLEDSEDELRALISNRKRPVRHGVLSTLDGLGKARRDDFLTVYMLDLASTDCDVRRVAVEKLGRLGDRRALAAIRTANRKDEANTPWYALSCLGSRPENAEKAILASR